MFDIGFSELLLFGVIALIVLGPEKLPQAARTAGQWYAKLRRTVSTLQSEIEAELDLAETRQQMQNEIAKIRQTEADMKREMAEMRGSIQEFEYSQNQSLNAAHEPVIHHKQNSPETNNLEPNSPEQHSQNQTVPAEFAYAYHQEQQANDSVDLPNTDTTAQPIATRPWENMWFRLGAYDKARRLPSPPRLPNYQADILLHTTLDNTVQSLSTNTCASLIKQEAEK